MQADPNPSDGDLATVYYSTQSNLSEDDEFQIATFPETVILPSAISNSIEIGFMPVESGGMFDCWGNLSSNTFNMDVYTDDGQIRIQYTSSNGINYTRTRFEKNGQTVSGNEMDFDTVIKFGNEWGEATWNDAIGYFMLVGSSSYEGLYQYGSNTYSLAKTQLNIISEDVYGNKVFYGKNGIGTGTLQNITNLNQDEILARANVYSNLSYLELNENITNLGYMFRGYSNLVSVPNFNTSNVTNMVYMFENCRNLRNVPEIDTSNIIYIQSAFKNCENLTSVPNFNTSKATDMGYMFYGCTNLVTVPEYDTSNVISTMYMFYNCYNLMNIPQFNMSNINFSAESMFWGCNNLTMIPNLNMQNVNLIPWMFCNCTNIINVAELNMSNAWNIYMMFANCYNLVDIALCDMSNASDMTNMFINCNNLSENSYANIANMLPSASKAYTKNISNMGLNINNFTSTQKKILGEKYYKDAIPYAINTANTSTYWNIKYNSTWKNISKGNYDVLGTNLKSNLPSGTNLTVNVYDYGNEGTLYYADNLFSGKNMYRIINLTGLKTEKVCNTFRMFYTCYNTTTISNFNTSNVIDMSYMFWRCYDITSIPNLDTSNVTNMSVMFDWCRLLKNAPTFNTSNVINMHGMFGNCFWLENIPNYNTAKVTHMGYMFSNCNMIRSVPNFNTSKVVDMRDMFYNCSNLTTIPNFNTNNVTNMSCLFMNCTNLTTIPEFDTSSVNDMSSMFKYCNKLSNASIQNIVNMCINSNVTMGYLSNLNNSNPYSPLNQTKFDSSYYSNRLTDLTNAGWSY